MNDNETRRLQMFMRARDFGVVHTRDFADGSRGKQLFTTLATTITQIESHAASEETGKGQARQSTITRSMAREALREDLDAISRTADAMTSEVPGLEGKFVLPPINDLLMLNAARSFVTNATPLRAQFVTNELPDDFLEQLNADIEALTSAISNQAIGVEGHVAAGVNIDDAIGLAIETVRKLDVVIQNKYIDDPGVLAEWTSASHTERAPRSKPTAPTPPPPPSTGAGSTPAQA